LINNNHIDILNTIGQCVSIENLSLRYITNASKLPSQVCLDVWRQAKKVKLVFSIDGIGKRFEHNRWPLQWSQVSANIEKIIALKLPNMTFGFSITITPFTAFYFEEVAQWISALGQQHPYVTGLVMRDFSSHASSGIINLNCVPDRLYSKIIDRYGPDHKISKLIQPFEHLQYEKFMKHIAYHDQKRGLNWREVYNEIQDCFD
jgi:hypothetical protein